MSTTSLHKHLQNGNGELARAKAALKGRLKQKMMQEALDELQDTEQVVEEAMEAFATNEETLKEAKAIFKARLLDHIRQQALGEIVDEVNGTNLDDHVAEGLLFEAKEAFKERLLSHVLQTAVDAVSVDVSTAQETLETHGEKLAEAKDTFKARLRDHVLQQALEEAGVEVSEAPEAVEPDSDKLAEAKEAVKARLHDHLLQQAYDEVGAEADSVSEDLFARAQTSALDGVKEAIKQRLLDHVYQQAIAEIDAEVDGTSDNLETFPTVEDENTATAEDGVPEDALTLEMPADTDAFADDGGFFSSSENVLSDDADTFKLIDDDPILDVEFWDDDKNAVAEEGDDAAVGSPSDEVFPEENESGFFLNDLTEPGSESEAPSDDEWTEAPVDDLLDFAGDGAWDSSVPYTDAIMDSDALPDAETDPTAALEAEGASSETPAETPAEEEGVVYYVYGVLSAESTAEDALPMDGIDPAFTIYPLVHDKNVALVSKVWKEEYGEEALAVNLLDPLWQEQRAEAHAAIIARLSADGLFLPVPYCTIYDSEDAVKALFAEIDYVDAMEKIKGCTQFRVRLYRNVDVLHQQVVENSAAVQQLMADIKSKPKGGSQSIKKKMVATIHEEEAAMTDNCTKDVHERLFGHAGDVELGALDGSGDREKTELILDATYLVHEDLHQAFSQDVEDLRREYALHGFEFDVTGPEPPTLFSHLNPFSKV